MDALVMCGGRGTRLGLDREKPLVDVGGRPMVDRVRAALEASAVERTIAVTSPRVPRTRDHLSIPTIDAPGEGYVADLGYALDRVDWPVLTVAADLPLLDGSAIDVILDSFDGDSMTACVSVRSKRRLGASIDTTIAGDELVPAGVNVVATGDRDRRVVLEDPRLAVNVNRRRDLRVAEALLRSGAVE